ncbi:hypothetical protein ElyMa_007015900 [Elysia marginata]|uniref:Uncharacterized protein n=1 Tax=Elysia marginata TaxID=1093978 RepID=A0AAV4JTZ1_9GAST|nr:hypothetical protein ElyMa_007015900 [Elysia marginata]
MVVTNMATNGVKQTINMIQIHKTDKTTLLSLTPEVFVDCVEVEVLHSSVFLRRMMIKVVEVRTRQKQQKDGMEFKLSHNGLFHHGSRYASKRPNSIDAEQNDAGEKQDSPYIVTSS